MEVTCRNKLRQSLDINKELFVNPSRYRSLRWLDRSCLLAKWLREKVRVRVRVRAGAREYITLVSFFFFPLVSFFFFSLVKILSSLVGLAPEDVTSRERTPTWVNKFSPIRFCFHRT